MNIRFEEYEGTLEASILRGVENSYLNIFKTDNTSKIQDKFRSEKNFHTILAFNNKEIIGFKIGYELNEATFYSWLGGVKEDFRGYKIAFEMMIRQHHWCQMKGYKKVQTKTLNRWRNMLILNIKSGFDIVQTFTDEKGQIKIVLEKIL